MLQALLPFSPTKGGPDNQPQSLSSGGSGGPKRAAAPTERPQAEEPRAFSCADSEGAATHSGASWALPAHGLCDRR